MTPFHICRIVLTATRDIHISGQQGAQLYALLCKANQEEGYPSAYPQDFLLDTPEQTRTVVKKDQPFAFGGTILSSDTTVANALLQKLVDRLNQLGVQGSPRKNGWGGNFKVTKVEDLVALHSGANSNNSSTIELTKLDAKHIDNEILALQEHSELTIRFESPVRIDRPRSKRRSGHGYLDDQYFAAGYFLRRIIRRLSDLGIQPSGTGEKMSFGDETIRLLETAFAWVDMSYGSRSGKTLGGLLGKIRVHVSELHAVSALVWGQYTRVGRSTNFGFGRYRIEQLGNPFRCQRAVPLLETAWHHPSRDHLVMNAGIESGVVSADIDRIRRNEYQPDRYTYISIGTPPKSRKLQIPSRKDRVLQRLVLEAIVPGVDQLFESSAFAWRKGLGRHNAAREVKRAYRVGYRFAINADFDRFFETIPHEILLQRLAAYLNDSKTVELIEMWVKAAADHSQVGIPTGCPISPFLGNLFLDRFDEQIKLLGGKLIRYGDDFLILFKDRSAAAQLLNETLKTVRQLELQLNEDLESCKKLDEPFQFLGFHFEKFDRWKANGLDEPKLLEELGWYDASQKKAVARSLTIKLENETGQAAKDFGYTAIVGPDVTNIEVSQLKIRCHFRGGRKSALIPIKDLENLVVLGDIGINSQTVGRLLHENVDVILADERGRTWGTICGDRTISSELVTAQVSLQQSPGRCLNCARNLIRSKLLNYAGLADELEKGQRVALRTRSLLKRLDEAKKHQELLGIEGYAASIWYETFDSFLGNGFAFDRRVSPNASDPVNVLLNIGYTLLYRLISLSIRSVGLCPSLGMLHVSNTRFQALTTDLQESFRFLIDRAVIVATHKLKPNDFRKTRTGQYSLVMSREAARYYQKLLWDIFNLGVQTNEMSQPASYLVLFARQARNLRRHLQNSTHDFLPFTLSGQSHLVEVGKK